MDTEKLNEIIARLGQAHHGLDIGFFLSALLVALAAAYAASLMYRFFYERRGTGSQVHRSFPLLALSITTLFIGVQVSIPLSLGLLGSLSIIRFRTPIKEPEEVGFIMLVIASSICAATDCFGLIGVLFAVAFASLLIVRGASRFRALSRDGVLVVSIPGANAPDTMLELEKILAGSIANFRLESSSSDATSSSWQYSFTGLRTGVPELQKALRERAKDVAVNVLLDRPTGSR